MGSLLGYVLLCAVPALAFWSFLRLVRWYERADRMPWQPPVPPRPTHPPLERLAADLRRLEADRHVLRSSNQPARAQRLMAAELAYEDVLLDCCEALELSCPGPPPLTPAQRRDTEAALFVAGLRW
ncbi:MAG TPA: hypothetical protein VES01_08185 [Dermatophilaceae bacterium]|nr:hypothetical protein [Dermatophilaceae bacterium]